MCIIELLLSQLKTYINIIIIEFTESNFFSIDKSRFIAGLLSMAKSALDKFAKVLENSENRDMENLYIRIKFIL